MIDHDRRNSVRISVSLPVQFQVEDGSVHNGTIENLSESGMLLVSEAEIRIDSLLRVMFGSYEDAYAVELSGKVVRSGPVGDFGIAFVEVNERAHAAIQQAMSGQR